MQNVKCRRQSGVSVCFLHSRLCNTAAQQACAMSSLQWIDRFEDPKPQRRDDRQRPVILLVEDNDDARRVYGLILRHFGYAVEETDNGRDAVELARSGHPDLVLMDIGLPGIDGWEASRLLKANPATARIPLIAFSARVDSTADITGASGTFDGYVRKPIQPKDLVRRVNAYLELLGLRDDGTAANEWVSNGLENPDTMTSV